MVDEAKVTVKAGDGGKGCDSRIRLSEKKLMPTGGEGGDGGEVIIRADSNVRSLKEFLYHRHFVAESGGPGGSSGKKGKRGKGVTLLVPCGTVVTESGRNFLVRDLVRPGDEVVVLEGGRGGMGNEGRRTAQPGKKGESLEIVLTLKIPAEVFLLGLPNSGKSKLLNRLTRAHSKEESYPFSTRIPQLGSYETSDYRRILLCELPAIYRESFSGKGLGANFLKHLERARMILFVLDPLSAFASSLKEGYDILRETLEKFQPALLGIPHTVVVNKMDLKEARDRVEREKFRPGIPLFLVSAETGEGLEALMGTVTDSLKGIEVPRGATG